MKPTPATPTSPVVDRKLNDLSNLVSWVQSDYAVVLGPLILFESEMKSKVPLITV